MLFETSLGLANCSGSVYCLTGYVACSVKDSHEVGDFQRVSVEVDAASVWSGCGLLSYKRGRSHLSSGHAVYGIVDEYHDDIFAAVGGMY